MNGYEKREGRPAHCVRTRIARSFQGASSSCCAVLVKMPRQPPASAVLHALLRIHSALIADCDVLRFFSLGHFLLARIRTHHSTRITVFVLLRPHQHQITVLRSTCSSADGRDSLQLLLHGGRVDLHPRSLSTPIQFTLHRLISKKDQQN